MDIRNVTQFTNFIKAGNLQNLDMTFLQAIMCVENYSKACNCRGMDAKRKMYENCTTIYTNAVRGVVPKLKNEFLSKTQERMISFYTDDGTLIGVVSRQ